MRFALNKLFLSLGLIFLAHSAFADDALTNNTQNLPTDDDQWHFQIAPYVWALNMNGSNTIGNVTASVDQSFSDLLNELNFAAMGYFSVSKGDWGGFLNAIYAVTSTKAQDGNLYGHLKNHFGIFTLAATYKAYQHYFSDLGSTFTVTPYLGARYTINDTSLNLSYLNYSASASENQNWADPVIGTKLGYQFNKNWSSVLFADVGGTNTNIDYSYQLSGFVGYNIPSFRTATIYGGYEWLHQRYDTGSGLNAYGWNMNIYGPILGVSFAF